MLVLVCPRSLEVQRMNPISFYVIVGAVSFTKCQFNFSLTDLSRKWNYVQVFEDQWKAQNHEGNDQTRKKLAENIEDHQFQKMSQKEILKKASEINVVTYENDVLRGLQHLNKIYDRCRRNIRKMKEKLGKKEGSFAEFKGYLSALYECFKVSTFRCLDEVFEADFIPLTNHAYFVKDGLNFSVENNPNLTDSGRKQKPERSFQEYTTDVLSKNWKALMWDRLSNLLRGYSLKFQMGKSSPEEGRGRRRDHRMFAMMVMGFMIMASILIPMGFQFLTVLGGKSLLMAKMALIMSAINGLKKIATSNVGYGFYHTGSDGHHHDHVHHGFHEKLYHANPQGPSSPYGFNL